MDRLSPREIADRLAAGDELIMLDVREPWEFEIAHLDQSVNIPMQQIPAVADTLAKDVPTVVICHHGMRSFEVAKFLESNGFSNLINLEGGIEAWACNVDPSLARY